MGYAKSVLLGAAFAGFASSSLALDVQFEEVFFDSQVLDVEYVPIGERFLEAASRSVILTAEGVSLEAGLEVLQDASSTRVTLSASTAFTWGGVDAYTQFSGLFILSEPAYIQFFGQIQSDSADPFAVNSISVYHDGYSSYSAEAENQYGQSPDVLVAINGIVDSYFGNPPMPAGSVVGNPSVPQLLEPGEYWFGLSLAARDFSGMGEIEFNSAGAAGFILAPVVLPEPEPEPAPPTLEDVSDLIQHYVQTGEVSAGGIGQALEAKLTSISSGVGLRSFIQFLQAQRGKHISTAAADDILELLSAVSQ